MIPLITKEAATPEVTETLDARQRRAEHREPQGAREARRGRQGRRRDRRGGLPRRAGARLAVDRGYPPMPSSSRSCGSGVRRGHGCDAPSRSADRVGQTVRPSGAPRRSPTGRPRRAPAARPRRARRPRRSAGPRAPGRSRRRAPAHRRSGAPPPLPFIRSARSATTHSSASTVRRWRTARRACRRPATRSWRAPPARARSPRAPSTAGAASARSRASASAARYSAISTPELPGASTDEERRQAAERRAPSGA